MAIVILHRKGFNVQNISLHSINYHMYGREYFSPAMLESHFGTDPIVIKFVSSMTFSG